MISICRLQSIANPETTSSAASAEARSDQTRSGCKLPAPRRRTSHKRCHERFYKRLGSRLKVPWTSRSLCQRGGASEGALAISCHDRFPRSPTFNRIAPSAAMLLDETGSAAGIVARHRCGGLTKTSTSPSSVPRASRNRAFCKGRETWRRSHAPSRATKGERPAKLHRMR